MTTLTEQQIVTIKDAARKLTGAKRRAFQAQVALDYLDSKARAAEWLANQREESFRQLLEELVKKGIGFHGQQCTCSTIKGE